MHPPEPPRTACAMNGDRRRVSRSSLYITKNETTNTARKWKKGRTHKTKLKKEENNIIIETSKRFENKSRTNQVYSQNWYN